MHVGRAYQRDWRSGSDLSPAEATSACEALAQRAIARSTAVCSSGESATDAVPRSTSFT